MCVYMTIDTFIANKCTPDGLKTQPRASEVFYGLEEPAFAPSTDPKFFYLSASHDRAAQHLLSAIRARDRIVVITGEAGTGKTMLCRTVVEELDRRTLTSFVAVPSMTVEGLLATLLCDFGVMSRDVMASAATRARSRRELSATLRDFLQLLASLEASAVAILDDAHQLSTDVLQQIRVWADPESELRLLQIVLAGQPALEHRLRRRELRSVGARVGARITLRPIAATEIGGYLTHRLAVASAAPRVEFDEGARAALYAATRGVPRAINQVGDRALALGAARAAGIIDAALVAEAVRDVPLAPPERAWRSWVRRMLVALALGLLVVAGAAGAAWVFRAPLDRLVQHRANQVPPAKAPRRSLDQ